MYLVETSPKYRRETCPPNPRGLSQEEGAGEQMGTVFCAVFLGGLLR